jgi:AcrR family transcriptional regulator
VGRPKEHDDATRIALLDAAERLIDERGPDAASVRAVADEVGTTTRAVYSVFGSKQGLLEALATRLFEVLVDAIDAVPVTDDPAADVVEASLDGFRRTAIEHPSLYSLVFLRIVPELRLGQPGTEYVEAGSAAFGRLEARVERLDAAGALGNLSVRDAAHAVHALTEGLASMELRGGMLDPDTAESTWRDALDALLRGFAAPTVDAGGGPRRSASRRAVAIR